MPSTTRLPNTAALPREVVQIAERPGGLEFYFPPYRNTGAAVGFGAFGALSIALPLAAMAGLGLADGGSTTGWLAVVLVGGFALPVMVFGFIFLGLAAYLFGNSLTVMADFDHIAVTRRVFGLAVSRRSLNRAEISAVERQRPVYLQNQFSAEPRYRLVARHGRRGAVLVLAESLPGRCAVEQMGALIEATTGIGINDD